MKKKVTILMEHHRFAKQYARKRKKSVGAIVDDLFRILKEQKELPLHPDIKKGAGVVKSGTRDPWADLFGP